MRELLLVASLTLAGCKSGPADTSDTGPDTDGVAVSGEAGNLLLIKWHDAANFDGSTAMVAFFVDDMQGVYNPMECLFQWNYCFGAFPAQPGDVVAYDADVRFRIDGASFRSNGDFVQFAGLDAEYVDDVQAGAEYYYSVFDGPVYEGSRVANVAFDGDWGEFSNDTALELPPDLVAVTPDPMSPLLVTEGESVDLVWEPGGGTVLLLVGSSSGAWLYHLDDDGEHELTYDEIGAQPGEEFLLVLGRWNFADIDANGNALRVQAGNEQWYNGRVSHLDLSSRDEVVPVDTCGEGTEPLAAGSYWGRIDGFGDDLDPTESGCTGWSAQGADGLVEVELQPGEVATASYELLTGDGSVYVLTDCAAADSCVAGTDKAAGGPESVRWINDQSTTQTFWLVLDIYDDQRGGTFVLDLDIEDSVPPPLAGDCASVDALDPLGAGTWTGSLDGAIDSIDIDDTDCSAGTGANHVDRYALVEVGPSERVQITGTAGSDIGLVLLSDCDDTASCVAGAATTTGSADVSYANLTDELVFLTLVVDGLPELYELEVFYESIELAEEADVCADAQLLVPLGEGTWYGDLTPLVDALDPGASGCTGHEALGPDGIVRVDVPEGQRLYATLDMPHHDPVMYMLDDCDDTATCTVGADRNFGGEERLVLDNVGPGALSQFLVVDSFDDGGPFALSLDFTSLTALQPADSCGDLAGTDLLADGIYVGDLTGFADDMSPDDCTGFVADGGEGFARLVLEPGESAELALSIAAGDASLYVLDDCTDPASCVVGADFGFNPDGHFELVEVTNDGTDAREYAVGLDAYGDVGEYELHVRITTPE